MKNKNLDMMTLAIVWAFLCPLVLCDNHLGMHDNMASNEHVDGHAHVDESDHDCQSDPERGSCRDFGDPHWFYNVTTKRCEQFWYGGCGGNGNNYETQDLCQKHCKHSDRGTDNIVITEDDAKVKNQDRKSSAASSKCLKLSDRGRLCSKWEAKWFYNSSKSSCERFWYGGCDGNENRFDDEESCMADCKHNEDVCRMSVLMGNCRERLPRWYYDSARRECRYFEYSGCNGNGNRFISRDNCERQCLYGREAFGRQDCNIQRFGCCPDGITAAQGNNNEGCPNACSGTKYGCCDDDMTPAQGPEQEGCEVIEISSGDGVACGDTDYGCCLDGETAATGPNGEGCRGMVTDKPDGDITVDVSAQCKLPSDLGTCRDNMVVMWYYNMSSGRCQMFWYGGCNGNQNRFKSEKECLTICRQVVKEPEKPEVRIPVCDQPKEIGPCRSLIPRWFYNKSTRQCEEFNYGGCLGNQNNFEERETCERYCRRGTPVAKAGECPRMNLDEEGCSSTCYYDGDCPGNEKCCSGSSGCRRCSAPAERDREIELTPEEVCALDKETGPCRGAFTRYYYNSETAKCESFTYGGCRGNRNNFESLDLCRRYCRARREPQPRPSGRQNICEMRPALGPCYRNVTKFFYNINTLSCQTFTYGGCLGNHNNFVTESKCMSYCGLRRRNYEKQDLCKQDSERGSCRGSYTRYYYDARQGRCFEFIYGGCQGNGNNFVSDESCMNTCRGVRIEDRRPVIPRPAPTVQPPTDNRAEGREEDVCSLALITPCTSSQEGPFWYYDRMTGFCREIPNGECNNNRNNFQSRAQCEQYCNRDRACQPLYYTSEIRCLASIPSWTYNRQSGRCEQFNYGGCGGSANNFPNEEACRRKCEDRVVITPVSTAAPVAEDICSLRLQTPCTSSREGPFWYYDRMTGVCKEVPNGECNNNRNNFQSRAQCEQYCNRERVCQPLYYTSNIRCFALIPSWTYDRESGRCEQFDYGGCGGSSNNFASEDACRRKCEDRVVIRPVTTAVPEVASPSEVCAMPADTGNCLAFMMRWRYNAETGKCVQFTWGGCGGNKNNFESQQACEQYCSRSVVCQRYEEPDVECLAYIRRWNYDPQSNQCENFIYGGCGGNSNNFETFEACEEKCKEVKVDNRDREYNNDNRVSTWRDICQMRYDVGPCRQSVTKWFYNSGARKCETFTYGGCLGNHNNFETSEQCMLYCGNVFRNSVPPTDEPEPEIEIEGSGDITAEPIGFDVCHLPSETGVCRASINQWYYNHNMGECMRFIYGGCGGNGNRFSSQEECERQCNDRGICLLKQDTGMGYNFTTRYHFDYSSQSCTAFLFGGEDGNANNFETEAACLRKCDSLIRRAPVFATKPGTCPVWFFRKSSSTCHSQCTEDGNCAGPKKCCPIGCNRICLRPVKKYLPPKAGECPARRRNNGLLGACAPQCRDDSQCSGNQKCCYSGCGYKCVDPVSEQSGPKRGYCPAKLDKQGLLGACAPQCQDDRDCSGSQKCCYHGCGLRCVYPVADEPYQMDVPVRIQTSPVSDNSVQVTWSDPSLGGDQRIRDNRYYTIRYFSYDQGQYNYMNVTDLNGKVNGLSSDTEYHFSVRSNNPPYLSEWSTDVMTKTMTTRVVNKPGSCPVLDPNSVGICVNMCDRDTDCIGAEKCCSNGCGRTCHYPRVVNKPGSCPVLDPNSAGTCVNMCDRDTDCIGAEKCCSNGCGRTCQYPRGYDVCTLPMDRGECSDWEIRWYYKVDETGLGMCERFWFGGCEEQGNGNRFMNQSDCQAACGTPATEPPRTARPYDCRRSMFGCCADRYTPAVDREKSNCPETERREEEIVPVTPGASVTLRCYNSNNGTWYREGKLVESNDRRQVNNDGTLTVYAATIDDDGVYACHVYYGSSRPYIYRYMLQVRNSSDETVVVPIGILDGPDTIIVKPNHMAFLHCEVYGNPKPSVTWMKNGEALRTGVQYETFSNGTLLIRRATEADIDRYTCVADNRVSQSLSRTIKLNLREMIVARIENDNGRVTEGGRITLSCEGRGYPTPTITWEKMGQPIRTGGNVFISSEGRLEIRDATLDDTGSYSCIVANSEEKIETSTSVQVIRRIVPDDDDKCEDRTSLMKCRLIVTARLCGYTMYSKICCNSCKSFFYGRQ